MRLSPLISLCLLAATVGFAVTYAWPTSIDTPLATLEAPSASNTSGTPSGNQASRTVGADPAWNSAWGAQPQFVDVTSMSGIDFVHTNGAAGNYEYLEIMGGGVGLFDYDNDGDLDLYLVNGNQIASADPTITNRLYRNDGNWHFVDVTKEAGVGDTGYGQGCTAADYDNDGDIDLYVTNYGPNVMYRNRGDGTFEEVASAAGVDDRGWGQSCCFVDLDADGWLDLFVQNYLEYGSTAGKQAFNTVGESKVPDYPSPIAFPGSVSRLYRNRGDGTFEDITESSGIGKHVGKGMGLACVDFDNDGRLDIFVANDSMENFLFHNKGELQFDEIGHVAGVAYNAAGIPEASMGVDVADYDQDGDWDLIVPCLARQFFTLYRNDRAMFRDVSTASGMAQATAASTGFDAHFLDYDSDADVDLFFTCGGVRMREQVPNNPTYAQRYGEPDLLVVNDGTGHFHNVSSFASGYFTEARIGRGSAVGDIDNDGDLDIVISNLADRIVLLRNDTKGGRAITLDLVDKQGHHNRAGITVDVTSGERRWRLATHPQTTYLSQSDRRLHLSVPAGMPNPKVTIVWPDGASHSVSDPLASPVTEIRQTP